MKAINPATGETIADYSELSWDETMAIIDRSHETYQQWRLTDFGRRAQLMHRAAAVLRERADPCAVLMAREMGKPVIQGRQEIEKCAWVCDYYADNAERFLARQLVQTDASKSYVSFQPLGVVLAVMPWNFPFWQVFRFAAPALMAGNVGVLKHASNVPGCALEIENVFYEAGFPEGAFTTLLVGSRLVDQVIAHRRVAAVTLTGSNTAGVAVGRKCGEMLKKSVLELGGSDPYLILQDADIAQAAAICSKSRLINSGQSCIAAKRFIVVPQIKDAFEQAFTEQMRRARVGDPLADETEVGPQAREDLRDELHQQVQQSLDKGARLLCGGEVPATRGAWYPPTVLTDVGPGMAAYEEETFGPVAAIIPAQDEQDALRIANSSVFGLGAAVFTADVARGEAIAERELEAGSCFVNTSVRSDPRLPFGGIKESGYGRELAEYGIREFVNIKTVYVA